MKIEFPISNRVGLDFIGPGFFINDYGKHATHRKTAAQQADILLGKDPW
jgi:predicted nucleic acid-binding Zn ribbon protein